MVTRIIDLKFPSKIYFIGMPGCGKSTIGKEVAQLISLDFIDLDTEIEQAHGCSIPEIISQSGEETFREYEQAMLKEITLNRKTFLMATGGGAPCFYNNIQLMNQNGVSVYIKTPIETIAKRLTGDQKRPLIKSEKDEAGLLSELMNLLKKRSHFYEQAQITTVSNESQLLKAEIMAYEQRRN